MNGLIRSNLRPRLIPTLLVDSNLHLVKSERFNSRVYIGDPLNAAYIFSSYNVDELVLLDIDAFNDNRVISCDFLTMLARFTDVPLAVGGGIRTLGQIEAILATGVERVILGSVLSENIFFLTDAVRSFGSSSVSVIISYFGDKDSRNSAYFGRGFSSSAGRSLISTACLCESLGAGEVIIYDVCRDGTGRGFDCDFINCLSAQLSIPLVVAGGCGSDGHIIQVFTQTAASGLAVGSHFLFAPHTKQVLLNYPDLSFKQQNPPFRVDCLAK